MLCQRVWVASCLAVAALTGDPVWAQPAKPKDGPLGMKFVPLPKATFYMGWDGFTDKTGVKREITEDFEIAIHTVTQGQWQELMGKNPSSFSRAGGLNIKEEDLKHFPVDSVSWLDAKQFIAKLNEKEKGKGYQYRLPSEAEWEYACRGGATSEQECSFHFYFAKPTNDLSSMEANFDGTIPFGRADKGKDLHRTTKVGSYAPNKVGLYDMHGNIWQWCEDATEGDGSIRVVRGGGWNCIGLGCRAASRGGEPQAKRATTWASALPESPSSSRRTMTLQM
jgi:formylglycine-generating enzyme required for sulfatase activity